MNSKSSISYAPENSQEILAYVHRAAHVLQVMDHLLMHTSQRCVKRYRGNHKNQELQMDQAASPDKILLRNFRKRGENPDMDRCLRLRVGCYHQKTPRNRSQPLHYFTDFKCHHFRENVHLPNTYKYALHNGTR